ncbi:MAG: amino acid adenylation domain-containing protein, partial [Neisseriales bacterium]
NDKKYSYSELNKKANQLAHYLRREYQLSGDNLVALCLDRDEQILIGILGVLKAGGAYVPLDPSYPKERISYILGDTEAKVILTNEKYLEEFSEFGIDSIGLDSKNQVEILAKESSINPEVRISSKNLAYVIYTSGTTGKPKGVMIEHHSVINLIMSIDKVYDLEFGNKITAFTSYTFDVSVSEFFTALLRGAELHLFAENIRRDPDAISRYILANDINYVYLPPVLLASLPQINYPKLHGIVYAGEPCDRNTGSYWSSQKKLFNYYGPTETTIYSLGKLVIDGDVNLIGRPLNNTQAYVLDVSLSLLPIGEVGELYIGGVGLARGYLNRSDLTTERFITNPFQSAEDEELDKNARLYKTGDLVRYLADGNIEYIGRNDFQVKIRGFRIELGEIENKLLEHPEIKQVVVLANEYKNANGEVLPESKYLAAFYIANKTLAENELHEFLGSRLPDYMHPSVFVAIDKLPLTINGKLDRKALLGMLTEKVTENYDYSDYPEIESYLAKLWQELIVLNNRKIELNDSFFGLGGHSLLVTKLILKIRNEYGIVLTPHQIYEAGTLSGLANLIRDRSDSEQQETTIPKLYSESPNHYLLNKYQLSIYFAHQSDPIAYTVPVFIKCDSLLDTEKAKLTFRKLVNKHRILSGCIQQSDEGLTHIINADKVEIITQKLDESDLDNSINRLASNGFDLGKCVTDFRILEIDADKPYTVLSFSHHHIVADGYSIDLILKDYFDFYNDKEINESSYNYAEASRVIQTNKEGHNQLFIESICPLNPHFSLPANNPNSSQSGVREYRLEFNSKQKSIIRNLAKRYDTSINSIMLAGLYLAMYRFTSEENVNLGVVFANRDNPYLADVVGCMVNALPLEINFTDKDNYSADEFIKDFVAKLNALIEYGSYPLVDLLEIARMKSNDKLISLFNLVFASQFVNDLENNASHFNKLTPANNHAKFDLALNFYHKLDPLYLAIEFNQGKYTYDYIESFANALIAIFTGIDESISSSINHLPLLDEANYQKIVYEWNANQKPLVDKSVAEFFEMQVLKNPDKLAVVYEGYKLTYVQLNQKANQLAHFLKSNYKISGDDLIALCFERSEQIIIAILAVIKAGGAYVPLDSGYPDERIGYMLEDTQAKVLLTSENFYDRFTQLVNSNISTNLPIIALDSKEFMLDLAKESSNNLGAYPEVNSLVYVIYTSGTTGKPKGVMIEQQHLVSFAINNNYLNLGDDDHFLGYSEYVFDGSVFDIFVALLNGATLTLINKSDVLNPVTLSKLITENKINFLFTTTALFQHYALAEENPFAKIDNIFFGGEKCDSKIIRKFITENSSINLTHVYGPTETVVYSNYCHLNLSNVNLAPIGKPLNDKTAYVLDKHLQVVPVGAIGELYIGGDSIARGYLNLPELSSERFISNPLQSEDDRKSGRNSRLYKTGDQVRYLSDGNIEYIGRNDFQVKIRGFRIEMGEIESVLGKYGVVDGKASPIKQCVVLALEQKDSNGSLNGNKYLVAYYVSDQKLDDSDIYSYLRVSLAEYMVPAALVYLNKLPLTLNGKIDRRALPEPIIATTDNYVAPRNKDEELICNIYAEILGIENNRVGIMDDFFKIGGNSIIAIKLVSRLNKEVFNGKLTIANIFTCKNIASLVDKIESVEDIENIEISRKSYSEQEILSGLDKIGVLSFAQERLWFIENYEGGSNAYNTPLVYEISNQTQLEFLETAIYNVVQRHEVLRSILKNDTDGNPFQQVMDLEQKPLIIGHKSATSEIELTELLDLDVNYIYDLSNDYPIRVNIYELNLSGTSKYFLSIVVHHIAFDGWSMDVLLRDLHAYYEYHKQLKQDSLENTSLARLNLPFLDIQYKDFASWQRAYLSSAVLENQLNYWRNKLDNHVGLNMVTEFPRPNQVNYAGDDVLFSIDPKTSKELRTIAANLGVSLYSLMLSGFYIFLRAYSNQDDIIIGSPIANRHYRQLENLVGFFVNSLALRSKINPDSSLRDYILEIGRETLEAQLHQDLPFERLINDLQIPKDQSRHPLFQIMFGVQSFGSTSHENIRPYFSLFNQYETFNHREFGLYDGYKVAKFDMTIIINDSEEELYGTFNYATSLYSRASIERFIETYQVILRQFTEKLERPIKEISYLSEKSYRQIALDWNATKAELPLNKTLHQLFEEQVLRIPDNIAIVSDGISLSYNEFNIRANQLANYLQAEFAIKADDMIVLCLERSEHMLIAVQGALKAGAAYVPMDPSYPDDRKRYIAKDTKTKVLLTTQKFASELKELMSELDSAVEVISLDTFEFQQKLATYPINNPNTVMSSRNLAYVIYTSGTTGNPKGVMLEHRGVVNRIIWMNDTYPLTEKDRILQKTPYVFDVSVWELFWAHWYGARIVFAKPDGHKDSNYLIELMNKSGITVTHFVPSMLSVFEDTLEVEVNQGRINKENPIPSLRYIFCSGEALTLPQAQKCHKLLAKTELHNLYGPTEASVDVLYYDCTPKNLSAVYIGKPVYNTSYYVLDNNLNILPIGAVGELFIGGVQLARGYLNLAEMTASKFITNPFETIEEKETAWHQRLYRTGDLVRYLPDGNIEYIGRNDFQIKIRGFRVELGEIETALHAFSGVKNAIVLALEHKDANGKPTGNKYLVGYYVADSQLEEDVVLNTMALKLPEYMVPSALVHLTTLPVTINGKLDRRALPEPEFKRSNNYVLPRNELEKQVSAIFAEVLGIEESKISIHDDFFRLGGDSIIAIMLVSRIRQRLNLIISVKDIFSYKTIAKLHDKVLLQAQLSLLQEQSLISETGILTGESPLLPIQEWFFDKVSSGVFTKPNHWNMSFLIRTPALDIELIRLSATKLLEYHDSLRFGYAIDDFGNYHQYYRSPDEINPLSVKYLNCSGLSEEALNNTFTEWQSGFDLFSNEALVQIAYIDGYPDGSSRLFFALHHLLIGAVSWRIIANDMKILYSKFSEVSATSTDEDLLAIDVESILGVKGASYRQWVQAIKSYETLFPEEKEYWLPHITKMSERRENVDALLAELDKSIFAKPTSVKFTLDKETTKLLLDGCSAYNTKVDDLVLTAIGLTLAKTVAGNINYITLEGHGREELVKNLDLSHTTGWCTTMYPVRLEVNPDSLHESIIKVKESIHNIPNKGVGYGALFGYIKHPLPRISFNYLGQFDAGNTVANWKITGEATGTSMSNANWDTNLFNMNCLISHGEFTFHLSSYLASYIQDIFANQTKENLLKIITHTNSLGRNYLTASDVNNVIDEEYIEKVEELRDIEAIFLANSLQQGFIYHALNNENSDTAYRIQLLLAYDNQLDPELFKLVWQAMVNRFGSLRLRFAWDDEIIQIIDKKQDLFWNYTDLSGFATNQHEELIDKIIHGDRANPYDLKYGQLLRIHLIKCTNDHYRCLISSHHAILDGWSTPYLLKHVHVLYEQLIGLNKNEQSKLIAGVVSKEVYKTIQQFLQEHRHEHKAFWQEQLSLIEDSPDLNGLISQEYKGTVLAKYRKIIKREQSLKVFDGKFSASMHELAIEYGFTVNALLQFVWHKILHLYGNASTTVVGTTISGRNLPIDGIEEAIGLFINTLPLIVKHNSSQTIFEAIEAVQQAVNDMNMHSACNLADLEKNDKNLFETLFVYENYPSPQKDADSLIKFSFKAAIEELDYPLAILAYEKDNQVHINLKYAAELFSSETIDSILSVYETILTNIINTSDLKTRLVSELRLMDDLDYQQIVYGWNSLSADYPVEKTLVELFEEQVLRTPTNIALVYEDIRLSYSELNEKANQFANYLQLNYHIKADDLVALYLNRNEYMLIALLGVLKAGAAYVPLDPAYPEERTSYILADTKVNVIFTNNEYQDKLNTLLLENNLSCKLETVDSTNDFIKFSEFSAKNLKKIINSRNLAYVIYTSGTTGKPKGVMLEHASVINTISALDEVYDLNYGNKITAFTSYTFDVSVSEFFTALLRGAELHLFSEELRRDTLLLSQYLLDNEINYVYLPPVILSSLARIDYPSIRGIIYAGEPCDPETGKYWSENKVLFNYYGPTETSIYALGKVVKNGDVNLIGRPLANTTAYILDASLNPLNIGQIGELYLGGIGLARGYLNRQDLTSERFISNPFQTIDEKQLGINDRLYKTGDLCRYLADGNIEYLGRNDFQIKIRGFRIELGEIESALRSINGIKNAVALAFEHKNLETSSNSNKYLVAYYVAENKLDEAQLLVAITSKLPEYMLPSALVHLKQLPITVNGKLDRRALPVPDMTSGSISYIAPRNEVESIVAGVIAEVLSIAKEQVGIYDDFFKLGANSISLIKIASRLNAELKNTSVKVSHLFKHRNIASLLENFNLNESDKQNKMVPVKGGDKFPLSFAQERLWFIETYENNVNAYNTLMVHELVDNIDITILEESLFSTIKRHQVLHSLIQTDASGHGYQQIGDLIRASFTLEKVEVASLDELRKEIELQVNYHFDLSIEYPFLIKLYQLNVGNQSIGRYLTIVIHHIAFDGWSMDIFLRDMESYYEYYLQQKIDPRCKLQLPDLDVQYKDFAIWQRKHLSGVYLSEQLNFWNNKLAGFSSLNLPTDYLRPVNFDYQGDNCYFKLDAELSIKVRELSKKLGVSLYSTLLSGFYLLLNAYSGQSDIVIGSPVANRNYPQLENMVGFFVNTLAMRSIIDKSLQIEEYIKSVGNEIVTAQLHEDLPFEQLVNCLGIDKDSSRHPIFQVMFSVQSFGAASEPKSSGLFKPNSIHYYEELGITDSYKVAKFDLSLMMNDEGSEIHGTFNFATSIFNRLTIERLIKTYLHILSQLTTKSETKLAEIVYLTDIEKNHLLYELNQTRDDTRTNENVIQLFEEQVKRTPTNIALVYENVKLTYLELNLKVNQLANYLQDRYQIIPDQRIALFLERSQEMLVAMLAILKIGAAYLPIAPDYPDERINYILADAEVSLILTNTKHDSRLASFVNLSLIELDDEKQIAEIKKANTENPLVKIDTNSLAYVIYTSGTTGKPKGVMVEHRSLVNLTMVEANEFDLPLVYPEGSNNYSLQRNCLQYASYVFDAHVWETFVVITRGHQLHILSDARRQDIDLLAEYVEANQIYFATIPPALLVKNRLIQVQKLVVAGDKTDASVMKEYYTNGIDVINAYGPTETTVCATIKHFASNVSNTNIGTPITNYTAYVLDVNLQLLPAGSIGELYIGGEGLARGYLNNQSLTDERFLPNPYQSASEQIEGRNSRIYKTGDLVRYLENGELEYVGRDDSQVKIRGFRIELSEIEAVLSNYKSANTDLLIEQSVVIAISHKDGHNKYLVAYYVAKEKLLSQQSLSI